MIAFFWGSLSLIFGDEKLDKKTRLISTNIIYALALIAIIYIPWKSPICCFCYVVLIVVFGFDFYFSKSYKAIDELNNGTNQKQKCRFGILEWKKLRRWKPCGRI